MPAQVAPTRGAVTLPLGDWIVNPDGSSAVDQLTDSMVGLLTVMGTVLDRYGLGETFTRRVFSHGEIPLYRGDESGTPPAQLLVSFTGLTLGDAGEQKFTYAKGVLGSFAHMTAAFECQAWIPWPMPEGGLTASLTQDKDTMAQAMFLNKVGIVLFSALRSLALGGTGSVRIDPPVTPIQQDGIHVGPLLPKTPAGGLAGLSSIVQLQYS